RGFLAGADDHRLLAGGGPSGGRFAHNKGDRIPIGRRRALLRWKILRTCERTTCGTCPCGAGVPPAFSQAGETPAPQEMGQVILSRAFTGLAAGSAESSPAP